MIEKKTSKKSNSRSQKRQWKLSDTIIVAIIGLLGTILAALLSSPLAEKWLAPKQTVSTNIETQNPLGETADMLTPTPTVLRVSRTLDLRSGCYEDYSVVTQIPAGAIVIVLPSFERRFDKLNRECVLVEYPIPKQSFSGWVLLIDLVPQ